MLADLVRLARPRDWIKNVFVALPVPFALAAGERFEPVPFILGLLGFCLISSAVYTINDLHDAASDRLHPVKRLRPVASGAVTPRAARIQWWALLCAGLLLLLAARRTDATIYVACYVLIAVAYCQGLKHAALIDVFLLSAGYVIRVLIGCALIGARPSPWLLLCTGTLALFIGFVKRRAEVIEELDPDHRPSLRGYNKPFLDQAVGICAGVAILAYALYCIEVIGALHPGRELVSMPFAAFGILNYLRLAHVEGMGGSPVDAAYRSPSMQICALGWLASVTWSLGLW